MLGDLKLCCIHNQEAAFELMYWVSWLLTDRTV